MKDLKVLDGDIKETLAESVAAATTQEEKLGVIQSLMQTQFCRDQQTTNKLLEQILKELQNGKESRIEQEKKPQEKSGKWEENVQEKTPEVSSKPVGSYDERPEVQHDPGGF